jgi:hypothetical protein
VDADGGPAFSADIRGHRPRLQNIQYLVKIFIAAALAALSSRMKMKIISQFPRNDFRFLKETNGHVNIVAKKSLMTMQLLITTHLNAKVELILKQTFAQRVWFAMESSLASHLMKLRHLFSRAFRSENKGRISSFSNTFPVF